MKTDKKEVTKVTEQKKTGQNISVLGQNLFYFILNR